MICLQQTEVFMICLQCLDRSFHDLFTADRSFLQDSNVYIPMKTGFSLVYNHMDRSFNGLCTTPTVEKFPLFVYNPKQRLFGIYLQNHGQKFSYRDTV